MRTKVPAHDCESIQPALVERKTITEGRWIFKRERTIKVPKYPDSHPLYWDCPDCGSKWYSIGFENTAWFALSRKKKWVEV